MDTYSLTDNIPTDISSIERDDEKLEINAKELPNATASLSYLKVRLNGINGVAVLDTGSSFSIISLKTAIECGLKHRVDTRYTFKVKTVESRVETCGTIMDCQVELQGHSMFLPMAVIDTHVNMIIGADILEAFKAKIDYSSHTLKLQFETKSRYVRMPLIDEEKLNKKRMIMAEKKAISIVKSEEATVTGKKLDRKVKSITPRLFLSRPARYVNITIYNVSLHAMIDTGAIYCVLPERIVNECGIVHLIDPSMEVLVAGADGIQRSRKVIAKCEFLLNEISLSTRFLVAVNAEKIILGQDILKTLKATGEELQFNVNNTLTRHSMTHFNLRQN